MLASADRVPQKRNVDSNDPKLQGNVPRQTKAVVILTGAVDIVTDQDRTLSRFKRTSHDEKGYRNRVSAFCPDRGVCGGQVPINLWKRLLQQSVLWGLREKKHMVA